MDLVGTYEADQPVLVEEGDERGVPEVVRAVARGVRDEGGGEQTLHDLVLRLLRLPLRELDAHRVCPEEVAHEAAHRWLHVTFHGVDVVDVSESD